MLYIPPVDCWNALFWITCIQSYAGLQLYAIDPSKRLISAQMLVSLSRLMPLPNSVLCSCRFIPIAAVTRFNRTLDAFQLVYDTMHVPAGQSCTVPLALASSTCKPHVVVRQAGQTQPVHRSPRQERRSGSLVKTAAEGDESFYFQISWRKRCSSVVGS